MRIVCYIAISRNLCNLALVYNWHAKLKDTNS